MDLSKIHHIAIIVSDYEAEYSCAGVPLFRRNGYRQSGGRKPLFRNRDTALNDCCLRVYSLKAGSNPYTSRMDL